MYRVVTPRPASPIRFETISRKEAASSSYPDAVAAAIRTSFEPEMIGRAASSWASRSSVQCCCHTHRLTAGW